MFLSRAARRSSPAMVVAMIALFVALGGAAGAVTAVPLAKRALSADNAKKLAGKTLPQVEQQIAAVPGPALVGTRVFAATLNGEQQGYADIPCDPGKRVVSGGFSTTRLVLASDSYPLDDSTWRIYLINLEAEQAPIALYAVCLDAEASEEPGTYGRGHTAEKQAPYRLGIEPR
jgi:hypothetical protein